MFWGSAKQRPFAAACVEICLFERNCAAKQVCEEAPELVGPFVRARLCECVCV
uniref:Uncharacterized protein n=1 Tax=Anopheles quadriannulatus TaxID=34691 RepID=A0A182XQM8_ANOQN